jgi:hypothetical protein
VQTPAVPLTKKQLEAFATLVGDPVSVANERLRADPLLLSLATEAADARLHRLHRGGVQAIITVHLLAAGTAMLVLAAKGWGNSDTWRETENHAGDRELYSALMLHGVLAAAGGLATGTLAVYNISAKSDAEYKALERYSSGSGARPPATPSSDRPWPTPNSDPYAHLRSSAGRSFTLPLLAFRF